MMVKLSGSTIQTNYKLHSRKRSPATLLIVWKFTCPEN